jgi:hypothetical protein
MAETTAGPTAGAAPRPAARRRRRGAAGVVLVLVAWLIGRGYGWFGAGGEAVDPGADGDRTPPSPAVEASPPAAPSSPTSERPNPETPNPETPNPATPSAVSSPLAAPWPTTATAPDGRGIADDRFASTLGLIELRAAEGALGSALAAVAHARTLPLDAAQSSELSLTAQALEPLVAAAIGDVEAAVAAGDWFRARERAATLLADGGHASARLAAALGSPVALDAPRREPDGLCPAPLPLPRHRVVTFAWRGQRSSGQVVDAQADTVTVRHATAAGQSFPTVPTAAVAPQQPTAAEAVEMAFANVHAGDLLGARLWLTIAERRSDGPLLGRGRDLVGVLR